MPNEESRNVGKRSQRNYERANPSLKKRKESAKSEALAGAPSPTSSIARPRHFELPASNDQERPAAPSPAPASASFPVGFPSGGCWEPRSPPACRALRGHGISGRVLSAHGCSRDYSRSYLERHHDAWVGWLRPAPRTQNHTGNAKYPVILLSARAGEDAAVEGLNTGQMTI
jgi:hypothetical protein